MNALVCSGGGAKGAFTAGVVAYLLKKKKIKFQLAVGTSTGALVGGPALLGEWSYLRDVYIGIGNEEVFRNSLMGKIVSLFVSRSVPIQANMDPLRDMLRQYYIGNRNGGKLKELNARGKNLVVTSVDVKTGKITYVSSTQVPHEISAETFVDAIVASASIPLFCEPVQIYANEPNHTRKKHLFYDGGIREFLPMNEAVRLKATKVWAVSTHALKFNQTAWGGNTDPGDTNLLKVLKWAIDSTLNEVERGDLFRGLAYYRVGRARNRIEQIATDHSLSAAARRELRQAVDDIFERVPDLVDELYLFYPDRPMSASLEFDRREMLAYYADGFNRAEDLYAAPGGMQQFTDAGGFVLKLRH